METINKFTGFTHLKADAAIPKIKTDMELNKLTIMCGMNGVGKTLIMKMIWAANTMFNAMVAAKAMNAKQDMDEEDLLQFILSTSFVDMDFTGTFKFYQREPNLNVPMCYLEFKMIDGKVDEVNIEYPEILEPIGAPIFMSKDARDFGKIQQYAKMKKMAGIEEYKSLEDMKKMCDMFKLYDIITFEMMLAKMPMANQYLTMMSKISSDLVKEFGIKEIEYDKEKAEIYVINTEDRRVNIQTLSSGIQSMLFMMMGAAGGQPQEA